MPTLSTKVFSSGSDETNISVTKLRQEQMKSELGFTTLAADVFALSKQIEDIIGDGSWKSDVSGLDVQLIDLAAHIDANAPDAVMVVKKALEVTNGADLKSTLAVAGKADFAGIVDVASTLSASAIKIDGDTAGRLYLVGAAGQIEDEAKLTFDGSVFAVTGDLNAVKGVFSGNVEALEVTGTNGKFSGALTVGGDLIVNGTTTTVNSTTLTVDDKNIELASSASPSDAAANGGGITLKGDTDHTITWIDAQDAWEFSEHLVPAGTKDLGLTDDRWQNLWLNGNADIDGTADIASTLAVGGVATFSAAVTGSAGLKLAGDADFNGGVTANEIKIDSDVAKRVYIVGASGEIKDEANLVFDSGLFITGTLEASGAAVLKSSLDVAGAAFFEGTVNLDKAGNQAIFKTGGQLVITGSSDIKLDSDGGELMFTDSYRKSSSWSLVSGISLSDSPSEWSDFETAAGGEVSLLSAITKALTGAGGGRGKASSPIASAPSVDGVGTYPVAVPAGASVSSVDSADRAKRVDVYLNGMMMRDPDDYAFDAGGTNVLFKFQPAAGDLLTVVIR